MPWTGGGDESSPGDPPGRADRRGLPTLPTDTIRKRASSILLLRRPGIAAPRFDARGRHYLDRFRFPCSFDKKHGFAWGPDNEPVPVIEAFTT